MNSDKRHPGILKMFNGVLSPESSCGFLKRYVTLDRFSCGLESSGVHLEGRVDSWRNRRLWA